MISQSIDQVVEANESTYKAVMGQCNWDIALRDRGTAKKAKKLILEVNNITTPYDEADTEDDSDKDDLSFIFNPFLLDKETYHNLIVPPLKRIYKNPDELGHHLRRSLSAISLLVEDDSLGEKIRKFFDNYRCVAGMNDSEFFDIARLVGGCPKESAEAILNSAKLWSKGGYPAELTGNISKMNPQSARNALVYYRDFNKMIDKLGLGHKKKKVIELAVSMENLGIDIFERSIEHQIDENKFAALLNDMNEMLDHFDALADYALQRERAISQHNASQQDFISERDTFESLHKVKELMKSEMNIDIGSILKQGMLFAAEGRFDVEKDYLGNISKVLLNNPDMEHFYTNYALALARINSECAISFLNIVDADGRSPSRILFGFNAETLQKYCEKGLQFAKEFGTSGKRYFREAISVLDKAPSEFNRWFEKAQRVGRGSYRGSEAKDAFDIHYNSDDKLGLVISGVQSPKPGEDLNNCLEKGVYAATNGFFDRFLTCYFDLKQRYAQLSNELWDNAVKEFDSSENINRLKKNGLTYEEINDEREVFIRRIWESTVSDNYDFYKLKDVFSRYDEAHKRGIGIERWAELSWKAFRKKDGGYAKLLPMIFDYMDAGCDFDKTEEIIFELMELDFRNKDGASIADVVNSDIHSSKKLDILMQYAPLKGIKGFPHPTTDGTWLEKSKDILEEKITKALGHKPNNLTFNEILRLTSIDLFDMLQGEPTIKYLGQKIEHLVSYKLKMTYLIGLRESGQAPQKDYELDKDYAHTIVKELKKSRDPVEMTGILLSGLISRDPEKRTAAEEYFEKEKLDAVREFIEPKKVFNQVKEYLPGLKAGERESALKILEILRTDYSKKESLTDLVLNVQGLFDGRIFFDKFTLRMQEGLLTDLFGDKKTRCCAFFPSGGNQWASLNYFLDRDIGLAHIIPNYNGNELDPIGVCILVNCYDPQGRKVLLVDGVEGGSAFDTMENGYWRDAIHDGIINIAKDNKAEYVVYNTISSNTTPKKFIGYLQKRDGLDKKEISLRKCNGMKDINGFWNDYKRENPDTQYTISNIRDRETHLLEAFNEEHNTKGTVSGLVYKVDEKK